MDHASLKRITLTLARSKDFPNGSDQIGYDLIAPLESHGHINLVAWKKHRTECTVRHFFTGEDDKTGLLVHKAGGAEHGRWVFDYDPARLDDDEFRLPVRSSCLCARRICFSERYRRHLAHFRGQSCDPTWVLSKRFGSAQSGEETIVFRLPASRHYVASACHDGPSVGD